MITRAASRADVIDVANLPSEVLAGNSRHLSRIEAFECGEIVRVLGTGSPTMAEAAHELGMSRATLYRSVFGRKYLIRRLTRQFRQGECGPPVAACLFSGCPVGGDGNELVYAVIKQDRGVGADPTREDDDGRVCAPRSSTP